MKINADNLALYVKSAVFVDGIQYKSVFEVDTDRGYVDYYQQGRDNGYVVLNGRLVTHRVFSPNIIITHWR